LRLDPKWKQSIFETGQIFAAIIVRISLQEAITNSIYLVLGIEGILVVIVVGTSAVLRKKVSETANRRYRRNLFRAMRWIIGIVAGSLFATAYSLIVLLAPFGIFVAFGIFVGVLAFVVVATLIYYIKILQNPDAVPANG